MKKLSFNLIVVGLIMIMSIMSINTINVYANDNNIDINAKNYIVIDENNQVLISNNENEKVEVASICKLMTTLITLEKIDKGELSLEDKVVVSRYASEAEGSQAFLDAGSEYSVRDLLKSVIVASANDSAIALAELVGGSESNFVRLMNTRAGELGMLNTLYCNSTGLHAGEQYSTAYDTALLLNVVSGYPVYQEDCKIWLDKLIHPSGRETELVNTNRLIKYYPYCCTGKTGFTDEAGYCLSSTANRDNFKLTCVVLGCASPAERFTSSVNLYNYAYANFSNEVIMSADDVIGNDIRIIGARDGDYDFVLKEDFRLVRSKDGEVNYRLEYNLPSTLKAPIGAGDKIGYINVLVEDKVVGSVDVISRNNIDKLTYGDAVDKVIDRFGIIN